MQDAHRSTSLVFFPGMDHPGTMRDGRSPSQGDIVRTKPPRSAAPRLARSLGPHLARLAKASGAMDPRLASDWPKIAGKELATLCRPVRVINRGRTQALEVSVKNGAAAMRVQYAQEQLLGRVRQAIGLPRLSRIVIREGAEGGRSWKSRRMERVEPAQAAPRHEAQSPTSPKSDGLRAALDSMRQTIHETKR